MQQTTVQDEPTVQDGRSPKRRKMNPNSHSDTESGLVASLELREKALTEREVKLTQKEGELKRKEEELKQKEERLNEKEKTVERNTAILKQNINVFNSKRQQLKSEEEALKQKELALQGKELAQEKRINENLASNQKKEQESTQENISDVNLRYREYLSLFLLEELLSALEKDMPSTYVNAQDEKYFEFVKFLQKGLGQLNDFKFSPTRPVNSTSPNDLAVLEREYKVVLIFTAILRFKDKESRPEWVGKVINLLTQRFSGKASCNTFKNVCERLRVDKELDEFVAAIRKEASKTGTVSETEKKDLLGYEDFKKANNVDIPDKEQLLNKRNGHMGIFEAGRNTFQKVFNETYPCKSENRSVSSSSSDSPLSFTRNNSSSEKLTPINKNISSDLPPRRLPSIIPLLSMGFLPPPVNSIIPESNLEARSRITTDNGSCFSYVGQGASLNARSTR